MEQAEQRVSKLREWLRWAAGGRGLLLPVSGGTDSALCFWLCRQTLGEKVTAIYFGESLRAGEWFARVGPVEMCRLPAEEEKPEVARWARLLSLSLSRRVWLAGSRNRTEDVLGTYSLASRVATIYPLVGLWKTEVLHLCEMAGVPEEIIASSHEHDVPCGRTGLMAEIGLARIDEFLQVRQGEVSEAQLQDWPPKHRQYLEDIYQRGQSKRELPLRAPDL